MSAQTEISTLPLPVCLYPSRFLALSPKVLMCKVGGAMPTSRVFLRTKGKQTWKACDVQYIYTLMLEEKVSTITHQLSCQIPVDSYVQSL